MRVHGTSLEDLKIASWAAMSIPIFCTISGIEILIIKAVEIGLPIVAGQSLNWVAMSGAFIPIRMKLSLFTGGELLYVELVLQALTRVAKTAG